MATSGFSRRKAFAFSRPWPNWSPSKVYQAPLFFTMPSATATSSRLPSQEMPLPNMMSNSATRNGGATLFFTTRARTRLPICTPPSLIASMRRTSIRTLE